MVAKLCVECGGSGEVFLSFMESKMYIDAFVDVPIWRKCSKCNGLGYITIGHE